MYDTRYLPRVVFSSLYFSSLWSNTLVGLKLSCTETHWVIRVWLYLIVLIFSLTAHDSWRRVQFHRRTPPPLLCGRFRRVSRPMIDVSLNGHVTKITIQNILGHPEAFITQYTIIGTYR